MRPICFNYKVIQYNLTLYTVRRIVTLCNRPYSAATDNKQCYNIMILNVIFTIHYTIINDKENINIII